MDIIRNKRTCNVPVIIVANKCDLVQERKVSKIESFVLAKELGCPLIETSAKLGLNIEKTFKYLVLQVCLY